MTISPQKDHRRVFRPGERYNITYMDSSGQYTEREIQVLRITHRNGIPVYIKAYCRLRMENRTFRTDRIIQYRRCDDHFTPKKIDFFHNQETREIKPQSRPVRTRK
ncbi:MAG: WYL domain-containing protein, partial [Spirochaetia bacterium]